MATRVHRNYHISQCIGVQFGVEALGRFNVEDVTLIHPKNRDEFIQYDQFKKMVIDMMANKVQHMILSIVWRNVKEQHTVVICTSEDFDIVCKFCRDAKTYPVFTVLVKETTANKQ